MWLWTWFNISCTTMTYVLYKYYSDRLKNEASFLQDKKNHALREYANLYNRFHRLSSHIEYLYLKNEDVWDDDIKSIFEDIQSQHLDLIRLLDNIVIV